ncbi:hypothetical protein CPB84DRAFT_1759390 [Gymnopilus junonius]|uniref:FMR1-interacting protein 1 conserved domain-containing protein n=1 Tax=Gymnopilus junonius TaxID=109634 RepID=A0A9P5TU42_GYMJU|nr:hypothetical protein CPB84DRAFT_1759390 [Gymnopilus junonius]
MMDRHLIYPPGWEKRKNKPEWDADPSLKGKPIPIQGTNIILDTPEILDAWIKERKSRFPTGARVADKKRKIEEAVARGQLDLSDSRWPNKRRNIGVSFSSSIEQGRTPRHNNIHEPRHPGLRNRGKAAVNLSLPQRPEVKISQKTRRHESPASVSSDSQSDSDHDNEEPEVISSKLLPADRMPPDNETVHIPKVAFTDTSVIKKVPLQPRMPPKNPFASRPTLLRNLLLPEIRVTISNLSQAIRFLVDNDFLREVELKPGQASEAHKIEVMKPE